MLENQIIEKFEYRCLNEKTNNHIFYKIINFDMLDKIPDKCRITIVEDISGIEYAQNIKIDLKYVKVKDILNYTIGLLKKRRLINCEMESVLDFNNKFDLLRFQRVLRDNGIIVQFVFFNIEKLSLQEQMLFNEIYYFNSIYFNANSFIKNANFQTYFLKDNRVLDDRENYTKISVEEYEKDSFSLVLKKNKKF